MLNVCLFIQDFGDRKYSFSLFVYCVDRLGKSSVFQSFLAEGLLKGLNLVWVIDSACAYLMIRALELLFSHGFSWRANAELFYLGHCVISRVVWSDLPCLDQLAVTMLNSVRLFKFDFSVNLNVMVVLLLRFLHHGLWNSCLWKSIQREAVHLELGYHQRCLAFQCRWDFLVQLRPRLKSWLLGIMGRFCSRFKIKVVWLFVLNKNDSGIRHRFVLNWRRFILDDLKVLR